MVIDVSHVHTAMLPPGERSPRFPITESQIRNNAFGGIKGVTGFGEHDLGV
jgi:hypothetical protein